VVCLAEALTALAAMVVFCFLPFLATVAHDLSGAAVGRATGRETGVVAGSGAVTGSGKGIGVGGSRRGVAFLRVLTSWVRASICSLSPLMAVL